jgi:phage terminase Nu1 subunit (DNA packaging protein)
MLYIYLGIFGGQMADETAGKAPEPAGSGDRGPLLTTEQAARLIMKSAERVRQLSREGYIPRHGKANDARFHLLDVVQGYIRFRDDSDRRNSQSAQASRVADARAREIELRNATRESKLMETDEAIETIRQMIGTLRSELSGVPARSTRDLQIRRTMETAINEALTRAADIAGEIASSMERVRDAGPALEGPKPGSLGGGEPDPSADFGRPGTA